MQCFICGSEAEPFNSLTWMPAWVFQASYVPVRTLDWQRPWLEMDMCSCICFYVCQQFVNLNQSSTSLQSRRNNITYYTSLYRAHAPSDCVYWHFLFVCFLFFSAFLKCSTGPQPSWLTWINDPCYLRGDGMAVWVIQWNENGLMGFCFSVCTVRDPLCNCQECSVAHSKTHYHPAVFQIKFSTSLYQCFRVCVRLCVRGYVRTCVCVCVCVCVYTCVSIADRL